MVSQIYPSEFQLNKAKTFDTEASSLDLHCSFLMIFILPKFTIKVTILFLKLSVSHLYMLIFLVLHPLEIIFLSLSDLLEHLAMLQTSNFALNF